MTSQISNIASSTITPANNVVTLKKKGNTGDIIQEILEHDKDAYLDVVKFAPFLKGETVKDTAFNIWNFLKNEITYQVDPKGKQYVQYPRRLFANKVGDCKSFSIFTGAILRNLGIPYSYRLTNYAAGDLKHVYIVIPNGGDEIIIDGVYDYFNKEKKYYSKKDIMGATEIYSLGDVMEFDLGSITRAQMFIQQATQRIVAERNAAIRKGRNFKTEGFNQQLSYLRGLQMIVNSDNDVGTKADMLKAKITSPKLRLLIMKIISGLSQPLIPYWDNLDDEEQEEMKELVFELLPQLAAAYIYAFLPTGQAQNILLPAGLVKRSKHVAGINELAAALQLETSTLMYMMKTFFIEEHGMSPESYLLTESHDSIDGIGFFGKIFKGVVNVVKKVAPKIIKIGGKLIGGAVKLVTGVDLAKPKEEVKTQPQIIYQQAPQQAPQQYQGGGRTGGGWC